MTIPQELHDKWKVLRSESDTDNIVTVAFEKGISVTRVTISTALRTGKMNDEIFKVIADFYVEKANLIKQYI